MICKHDQIKFLELIHPTYSHCVKLSLPGLCLILIHFVVVSWFCGCFVFCILKYALSCFRGFLVEMVHLFYSLTLNLHLLFEILFVFVFGGVYHLKSLSPCCWFSALLFRCIYTALKICVCLGDDAACVYDMYLVGSVVMLLVAMLNHCVMGSGTNTFFLYPYN